MVWFLRMNLTYSERNTLDDEFVGAEHISFSFPHGLKEVRLENTSISVLSENAKDW